MERSLVRSGYGWRVPAGGEARVGVGSYAPADHVRRPTVELAEQARHGRGALSGQLVPAPAARRHRGTACSSSGDSAGHCFPLSGEGIRTAFYFGIACGRELSAVLEQGRSREQALRRYSRFSASHAGPIAIALGLQRLIPALPPRGADDRAARDRLRSRSSTAHSAGIWTRPTRPSRSARREPAARRR